MELQDNEDRQFTPMSIRIFGYRLLTQINIMDAEFFVGAVIG